MKNSKLYLFHCLKWTLIILIVFFSSELVTKPLRNHLANNYIEKGNTLLSQKDYLSAILEYKKSDILHKNTTADKDIDLATKAMDNATALTSFYTSRNDQTDLSNLILAQTDSSDKYLLVKNCQKLITNGEYQEAIIPAEKATKIDKSYRDAWLYLGISNLKTAEKVELYPANRKQYLANANSALTQALKIDPLYQPTKDFILELKKVK